jgi:hypothetical protein
MEIILQEGLNSYVGCIDAEIFSGAADTVQGDNTEEITWWSEGDQRNAVISWEDLSSIPEGSTITGVTISIYFTGSSATYPVVCRRILQSWLEDQVTWNSRSTGNSWATAGCKGSTDRSDTQSASTNMVASAGWNTWSSSQLITDVQNFIDGVYNNYGWIFQREDTNSNTYTTWATSEYGTAEYRPKITITYTESSSSSSSVSSSSSSSSSKSSSSSSSKSSSSSSSSSSSISSSSSSSRSSSSSSCRSSSSSSSKSSSSSSSNSSSSSSSKSSSSSSSSSSNNSSSSSSSKSSSSSSRSSSSISSSSSSRSFGPTLGEIRRIILDVAILDKIINIPIIEIKKIVV